MKEEAKSLWDNEIANDDQIKAVVFSSAKESGFIAGADIGDIRSIDDKQELIPIIKDGLEFFKKMKSKGIPLVSAIHGPALGGGLEWALWCDYRICSDSPKTKLGLPEVKLGLLPGKYESASNCVILHDISFVTDISTTFYRKGFGGTQNLHPLIGLQEALPMMLQGKEVRSKKAKKIGLVDMIVASQSLEQVAIDSALALADGTLKKNKVSLTMMIALSSICTSNAQ